jgi:hypothetical protein
LNLHKKPACSQTIEEMEGKHGRLPFRHMTGLPSFWTPFPRVAKVYANRGNTPVWRTFRPAPTLRRVLVVVYPDETTILVI